MRARTEDQEKKTLRLVFGAMAPRVSEQLREQGLTVGDTASSFDRDSQALTRLWARQLLTDREVHAARKRLIGRVSKALLPIKTDRDVAC